MSVCVYACVGGYMRVCGVYMCVYMWRLQLTSGMMWHDMVDSI